MFELTKHNKIKLTRGDTCYIEVEIIGNYVIQEGDILHFSVKKNVKDREQAVHVAFPANTILVLNPTDTKDLEFGKYYYDVQLSTIDGEVFTLIGPCEFILMEEITHD